jgi:hypothetical protein
MVLNRNYTLLYDNKTSCLKEQTLTSTGSSGSCSISKEQNLVMDYPLNLIAQSIPRPITISVSVCVQNTRMKIIVEAVSVLTNSYATEESSLSEIL